MNDTLSLQGERIAKVIARAGVCSRREAERKINDGKVTVDGQLIDSPALNVTPDQIITVEGKALPDKQPPRMWRYHKPKGLLTTTSDPEGRPTVFENLPTWAPRVISVGRLDFNTEGLLLLTNDGELARFLEKPDQGFVRRYRVRVHGRVSEKALEDLKDGLTVEGMAYGPIEAVLDVQKGSNAWINVAIREGKNREVRKIMESMGLEVTRLIRTDYGPFNLGKLAKGDMEEISRKALSEMFGGKVKGLLKEDQKSKRGFAATKKPAKKPPHKGKKPHADRRR